MAEFRSVEIDFDVYKRIELARESFSETPNAVLRRLLGLDGSPSTHLVPFEGAMRAWSGKRVMLPHGTQVRMDYNGRTHQGEIQDGAWLVEGGRFTSPSAAAGGVARTKDGQRTNLDGWIYWWALLPGKKAWIKLSDLRDGQPGTLQSSTKVERREVEMKHSVSTHSDLPPESAVMAALEALLRRLERQITPPVAYRVLADEFHLTKEQRTRLMDSGEECHWENRVRFARRKLVDAGIMAREPRGQWSLAK